MFWFNAERQSRRKDVNISPFLVFIIALEEIPKVPRKQTMFFNSLLAWKDYCSN